jgi:nicotinamidase-related amidase
MKTKYEDIVDVNAIGNAINPKKNNEIYTLAAKEALKPAGQNDENVLVIAIDMQNDFMDGGELAVPGAHGDVARFTRFIYDNMDGIARIAISLDTHAPHQIFHPCWWVDKDGNHPDPFTVITLEDLDNGKWFPIIKTSESREYVENLKKIGKKDLCVWAYHCIEGTFGAALECQFANMVYFHSIAKRSVVQRLVKGQDPLSEMYGIIKPEYDQKGFVNIDFLNKLEKFDKIVIGGEAKSHCVLESVRQILEFYAARPDITKKVYILEDCMSVIPGFETATISAFEEFKAKYHINVIGSTDLKLV